MKLKLASSFSILNGERGVGEPETI